MTDEGQDVMDLPSSEETYLIVKLGQSNGNVTTVGFPYDPDHDDIEVLRSADTEALNDHSRTQQAWLLSLPPEHQPYWTHLNEIDHLWPVHSERPPAWVSCPDHPDLEAAVAAHFSVRGHVCVVGNPADQT